MSYFSERSEYYLLHQRRSLRSLHWREEGGDPCASPTRACHFSDACEWLENTIDNVFPHYEYRDRMRHIYTKLHRKYGGKVYMDHLYPATRGFIEQKFRYHMEIKVLKSLMIQEYIKS
jgi:hypothetical protein